MKMTVQSFCFRDSINVVITFSMYTVNMNSEELIFHEAVYIYEDGTCIWNYSLTLLAPSYLKLHITTAPSNFSIIASFLIKMVTIVDLGTFLGHGLKSTMVPKELRNENWRIIVLQHTWVTTSLKLKTIHKCFLCPYKMQSSMLCFTAFRFSWCR